MERWLDGTIHQQAKARNFKRMLNTYRAVLLNADRTAKHKLKRISKRIAVKITQGEDCTQLITRLEGVLKMKARYQAIQRMRPPALASNTQISPVNLPQQL
jgi:hypothetical protein